MRNQNAVVRFIKARNEAIDIVLDEWREAGDWTEEQIKQARIDARSHVSRSIKKVIRAFQSTGMSNRRALAATIATIRMTNSGCLEN